MSSAIISDNCPKGPDGSRGPRGFPGSAGIDAPTVNKILFKDNQFKFEMENGEVITTNALKVPRGERGDPGSSSSNKEIIKVEVTRDGNLVLTAKDQTTYSTKIPTKNQTYSKNTISCNNNGECSLPSGHNSLHFHSGDSISGGDFFSFNSSLDFLSPNEISFGQISKFVSRDNGFLIQFPNDPNPVEFNREQIHMKDKKLKFYAIKDGLLAEHPMEVKGHEKGIQISHNDKGLLNMFHDGFTNLVSNLFFAPNREYNMKLYDGSEYIYKGNERLNKNTKCADSKLRGNFESVKYPKYKELNREVSDQNV